MGELSKDLKRKLGTVHSEYGPKAQKAATEAEDTLQSLRQRDRQRAEMDREEKERLAEKYPTLKE